MLPVVLIGIGATSAFLGLVSRRPLPPAHRAAPSPGGRIASPAAKRTASYAATVRWLPIVDQFRGNIPSWLLLGHIAFEADGDPRSNTDTVMCGTHLCMERGLMQLMPAESKVLGLDHDRMYDPLYSISAGVRTYLRYADLLRPFPFATADDFWRAAYFMFAIGSPTALKLLASVSKARPLTWSGFETHVRSACRALNRCQSVDKWLGATQAVWDFGHAIERRARAVS